MKKTTLLNNLLTSEELSFIMEAHSGVSAKIVEEAQFKGIWGSGLSISAAMGVRDNNEASWTQVLDVAEFMADATSIPILLDGDTGYGNFNNMRRLVKKLEQRGMAGVCIEDKIFPKTNSFLRGDKQALADIAEFTGKIKAGLDSRSDDDFCIVARVEAFIAGLGLEEALRRAHAYYEAGATAVLMHSKLHNPSEIFSFMEEWGNRGPIVIVPTKYYSTPTKDFKKHGISMVIWANQLLRSSIKIMQETACDIRQKESIIDIEDNIVPVKEVFRLQNDQELSDAEKKYCTFQNETAAIILAASQGKDFSKRPLKRPKVLLLANGKPILAQMVEKFEKHGIEELTIVRGFKKQDFPYLKCSYIDNDDFENTGELHSLYLGKDKINGELIISYGDIVFKSHILETIGQNQFDITIVVDRGLHSKEQSYVGDFVRCSNNTPILLETKLQEFDKLKFKPTGEWIGILKTNNKGSQIILDTLHLLNKRADFSKMNMGNLFNYLITKDIPIGVKYIEGHWMDVDGHQDFEGLQTF